MDSATVKTKMMAKNKRAEEKMQRGRKEVDKQDKKIQIPGEYISPRNLEKLGGKKALKSKIKAFIEDLIKKV